MLERLARLVMRRHWLVVGVWIVLTIIGAYAAVQVSDRWLEDFSIPGYSAYEANQRTLAALGNGEVPPFIAVLSADGDVTRAQGVEEAIDAAGAANPGSRTSSFFNTGSDAYVSDDGTTTFAAIYPAGEVSFDGTVNIDETRQALADAAPAGVETHLTGIDALYEESSGGAEEGPSVLVETLVAGLRGADDPAVHLRDPAGGGDAAAGGADLDPQHVHADLAADLRHRHLDHRAVPGGADRARGGDRLRPADDLPLPRGAAGQRPRGGAGHDHAPRGPLGDRVGVDRGHRPAEPRSSCRCRSSGRSASAGC